MSNDIKEIFRAYDKYIEALEDENSSLVGLAYVHGWRSSQVEFGRTCRAKIKELKKKWGISAPTKKEVEK